MKVKLWSFEGNAPVIGAGGCCCGGGGGGGGGGKGGGVWDSEVTEWNTIFFFLDFWEGMIEFSNGCVTMLRVSVVI